MNGFLYSFFQKLTGIKISQKQEKLLTKIFEEFYTFEDEIEPPSSMVMMMSSVCHDKLPQALSNSINCFGNNHGCFSDAAKLILDDYQRKTKNYPGFGHPKYKTEDPRVVSVLSYAKKIGYKSLNIDNSCIFAQKIGLPLNFGGLIACVLLDCGCNIHNIDLFPIFCRSVGFAKIYQKSKDLHLKLSSSHELIDKYNSTSNF